MIAKPVISPDFTIEDIHKIREYHYELTKDMTTQERNNFEIAQKYENVQKGVGDMMRGALIETSARTI